MHKILLVEDDKLIRDELETLLVNAGFSVRSVEDFDNTLEHIREEMPDLLLLDINLPGQNGYSLCARVRWFPKCRFCLSQAEIRQWMSCRP